MHACLCVLLCCVLVHCTDESPRRAKQPLSDDVGVCNSPHMHMAHSHSVVMWCLQLSTHAHGTLTLSGDVVSAVLHTCTQHVSLCNHLICCGVEWSGHSHVGCASNSIPQGIL